MGPGGHEVCRVSNRLSAGYGWFSVTNGQTCGSYPTNMANRQDTDQCLDNVGRISLDTCRYLQDTDKYTIT